MNSCRRHIMEDASRTLVLALPYLQLCRIETCRRFCVSIQSCVLQIRNLHSSAGIERFLENVSVHGKFKISYIGWNMLSILGVTMLTDHPENKDFCHPCVGESR